MGTRVLILDDDPFLRTMYHDILKHIPETKIKVVDCPEKLRFHLAQSVYDLLLLDIDLGDPNEDGISILTGLQLQMPRLPILMMSSRNDGITVAKCLDLGALAFQPKSVGFIFELERMITNFCSHLPTEIKRAG
jgi:DNA-binding NarL/FixJ family response regulator